MRQKLMQVGNLVHVPANVLLSRNVSSDVGSPSFICYYTQVPKVAIWIEEVNILHSLIEYGQYKWTVKTKDVALLEEI